MPISANQTITFDGRLTLSINRWMKSSLRDVFLGNNPVFVKIKKHGQVIEGGLGPQIVEPLYMPMAGGPQAEGVVDPYIELTHSPHTGITSAYFIPAEYAMPISVAKRDLKIQGSVTKKVDHVQSVMKGSLKRFFTKLNTDLWAAEGNAGSAGALNQLGSLRTYFNRGGGSTTGTIEPAALADQLGNAVGSSAITLVGGIERNAAGAGYWCTPISNPGSPAAIDLLVVNNMISGATRNEDVPDLGFLHSKNFDKLVTILQGVGYANLWDVDASMKKFSSFQYRGVDFCFDDKIPDGTGGSTTTQAFIINSQYLNLVVDTMEPEVELKNDPKRPLKIWMATWYGQLTSGHLGRVHHRHANINK